MNFFILGLCVCAASAASYDYQRYKFNKPSQQFTSKAFAQAVVKPAMVVPIATTKTGYKAVEIVAAPPTVSAKIAYTPGSPSKEADAATLRFESNVDTDGYQYNFETANGIIAQASGILKKVDDAEVIVSQGSYQFVAPDGTLVDTSYVADENGFQPRGSHIPVPPAVPEAILRSLQYISTHPQKSVK